MGEVSAGGLPGEAGVIVVEVPADSELAKLGMNAQDAMLGCDGKAVDTVDDLRKACQAAGAEGKLKLEVFRSQQRLTVSAPAAGMEKAKWAHNSAAGHRVPLCLPHETGSA